MVGEVEVILFVSSNVDWVLTVSFPGQYVVVFVTTETIVVVPNGINSVWVATVVKILVLLLKTLVLVVIPTWVFSVTKIDEIVVVSSMVEVKVTLLILDFDSVETVFNVNGKLDSDWSPNTLLTELTVSSLDAVVEDGNETGIVCEFIVIIVDNADDVKVMEEESYLMLDVGILVASEDVAENNELVKSVEILMVCEFESKTVSKLDVFDEVWLSLV